jgi:hypothetical protein
MSALLSRLVEVARQIKDPPDALISLISEYDESVSSERRNLIVAYFNEKFARDGENEVDDDALLSEGEDNGAYVETWTWLDFSETPWDKEERCIHTKKEGACLTISAVVCDQLVAEGKVYLCSDTWNYYCKAGVTLDEVEARNTLFESENH